jgi:hypothetical protein
MRFHVKQSDLIEQLRFMEKVAIGPFGATAGNAADEIERLLWNEELQAKIAALKDTTP